MAVLGKDLLFLVRTNHSLSKKKNVCQCKLQLWETGRTRFFSSHILAMKLDPGWSSPFFFIRLYIPPSSNPLYESYLDLNAFQSSFILCGYPTSAGKKLDGPLHSARDQSLISHFLFFRDLGVICLHLKLIFFRVCCSFSLKRAAAWWIDPTLCSSFMNLYTFFFIIACEENKYWTYPALYTCEKRGVGLCRKRGGSRIYYARRRTSSSRLRNHEVHRRASEPFYSSKDLFLGGSQSWLDCSQ